MGKEDFVRNQFAFYVSFEEAISMLRDKEQLLLYRGISRYSLFGEDPGKMPETLSKMGKMAWKIIFPIIKTARKKAEGGCVSKVNNPNGNNQYIDCENHSSNQEDKIEDKIEDNNIKVKDKVKDKCVSRTRTREASISPEDEKRLSSFDNLLSEKAPTFANAVPPISLEKLNELKAHASSADIIEVMEEIENKVVAKGTCDYSDIATTIRIFLQTKGAWKSNEK